jgi:hypothetical protein
LGDSGGPTVESSAPEPDAGDAAYDATIDTQVDTGPDRASTDTGAHDSAHDTAAEVGMADVAPNNGSDGGGVLCSFTMSNYCDPDSGTPDCCETARDGAMPNLGCVASMNCPGGYDIQCANASDCPGQMICCHYSSGMKCVAPTSGSSTCPGMNFTQACDPNTSNECPANQNCTLPITNNGMPSPYTGCR